MVTGGKRISYWYLFRMIEIKNFLTRLLPWGYAYSFMEKPADLDEMMEKAKVATDAIKAVNGLI